jgi:hypothetical protein
MMAPAIANDCTSIPNRCNIDSPRNKKANMITPAMRVAFPDCIVPDLDFKSIITGMEPMMSIIENKMIVTEAISLKFNMH